MCPLAVAGLGFKYLVTNSSDRLGHPFKKPFPKAFRIKDIFGLHITWCPNLTVLALVCTECANMATVAHGCSIITCISDCGVRAIQGPACDWIDSTIESSAWEVHSCFCFVMASGVIGNTHKSVLGSFQPTKTIFLLYLT